ncbi:MAG TPA: hypothetical protein VF396_25405 [Bradyrhizobium sp.]
MSAAAPCPPSNVSGGFAAPIESHSRGSRGVLQAWPVWQALPGPASSIGRRAMRRRTRSAACVISITNQIAVHRYQRVERQVNQCPGGFEMETTMKANLPWLKIATVAVTALSVGNLYHHLYSKSRHVSVCGAHLAQLQLIESQLDTTEAALNAAGSQLNRAKR